MNICEYQNLSIKWKRLDGCIPGCGEHPESKGRRHHFCTCWKVSDDAQDISTAFPKAW